MNPQLQALVGDPIISQFQKTPGAISVCEGLAIYLTLLNSPPREWYCVDLGSHAGKSSTFAVHALSKQTVGTKEFIMIDPTFDVGNDRAWAETVQSKSSNAPWGYCHTPGFTNEVRTRMMKAGGGTIIPRLVGDTSTSYLPTMAGDFSYVFIDSDDHQKALVDWEVNFLMDRMVSGGIVLFHDYNNQYHAPKEVARRMVDTGKYEFISMPWDEIREFVSAHDLERGNDSWHMPGHEFPCFVGGVRRK